MSNEWRYPWNKWKAEFVASRETLTQFARRKKVHPSMLRTMASKENWVKTRKFIRESMLPTSDEGIAVCDICRTILQSQGLVVE